MHLKILNRTVVALLLLSGTVHPADAQKPTSLTITPLTNNFYVFTTYGEYQGEYYPANGMYVLTREGAILFDSPWDTTQFQPLLDSIRIKHQTSVKVCFVTHFHEDRTAGLEYYRQQGIKTYTTRLTDDYSKKRGMKRAEFLIETDTTFTMGEYSFQIIYPGPGHAPDNSVAWFPQQKVLYGGCLIKSTDDTTLGNLGDANVKAYPSTLKNLQQKCPQPQYIIPGHNGWKSVGSLKHTLKMAEKLNRQTSYRK